MKTRKSFLTVTFYLPVAIVIAKACCGRSQIGRTSQNLQNFVRKTLLAPFRFPTKENPDMEKVLFDWPIMLQYHVKAKYWLISSKFSGMKFFQLSVPLTNQKPPNLHLFDKPINSLYFHFFVVSVLFARFHFKVICKSL